MPGPVLRRTDQENRTSTTLELLFDLCFVVAVAQVAAGLHNGLADGDPQASIVAYLMIFGAVWWAWMNFSWFASAHDSDDVAYRVLVFVQMAGVLTLAAGIPQAYAGDWRLITTGYVIMRLSLVPFWWWTGRKYPTLRRLCNRYASGIAVLQVGWIGVNFVSGPSRIPIQLALFACELAVPIWAEMSYRQTHWHREHIVERYGLFTIIVLGEAVLSATVTIQSSVAEGGFSVAMVMLVLGGLLTVFGIWWLYFDRPRREGPSGIEAGFVWGYSHLLVWASIAAFGAGLQIATESLVGHGSVRAGTLAMTVPLASFLLTLAIIYRFGAGQAAPWFTPALILSAFVLIALGKYGSTETSALGEAGVMAILVAMLVVKEGAPGVGPDALAS